MSFRESSETCSFIPNGCDVLNKELGSILWITSSLNTAKRIPSCKRRDSLILALTLALEDPQLLLPKDLNGDLFEATAKLSKVNSELELLKANYDYLHQQFVDDLINHNLQPNLKREVQKLILKHRLIMSKRIIFVTCIAMISILFNFLLFYR